MSTNSSTDPLGGMRFTIQIDSIVNGRFLECSSPTVTTTVKDYFEGGQPNYVYRYPVSTSYNNITLKYGTHLGHEMFDWYMGTVNGLPTRKDISIFLYDTEGNVIRTWILKDAYPVKWVGPALKADGREIAVETLEIAYSAIRLEVNSAV